jgi:hypothetical protein
MRPRTLRRAFAHTIIIAGACCAAAGAALADTSTFRTTGAEQSFVVPAGVTRLHVVAIGGAGGVGGQNAGGGAGNPGAIATADLAVTPGELLYVEVAGNGGDADNAHGSQGTGGFNGGGHDGTGVGIGQDGGGGGGASDVRTVSSSSGPGSLSSRLVIAAGGGGGGGGNTLGGAGGPAGSPGSAGSPSGSGGEGGGAGTASAGGAAGNTPNGASTTATAGTLGVGGTGASGSVSTCGAGGGGGGGGLFGGGGGGAGGALSCAEAGAGGGGGGSSGFGAGTSATAVSVATSKVPIVVLSYFFKPHNTGRPSIAGHPLPGHNLTCEKGSWAGSQAAFAYRWNRDGQVIASAGSPGYGVRNGDAGHRLTCTVTAANQAGSSSATSASVTVPVCVVPRLVGKSLTTAKKLLKRAHCGVGRVSHRTARGAANRVLSQKPGFARRLPPGSKVALVVSQRR